MGPSRIKKQVFTKRLNRSSMTQCYGHCELRLTSSHRSFAVGYPLGFRGARPCQVFLKVASGDHGSKKEQAETDPR